MRISMTRNSVLNFVRKPVFIALLVFAFLMVLTQYLAYERYLLVKDTELDELNNEANGKKERLQTALSYSQSTAQTLGFIVERYGIPVDFDTVAKKLLSANKFIDAVQLVQGGVITHVYPLKGNEVVIGYNILQDSLRNKGAFTAIETKIFFWAGPINLKQGGVGIVGRQPLFKNDKFYGFSAVIIRLPTLLHTIGLDSNFNNEFNYQLSRIDSAKHTEEYFLPNHQSYNYAFVVPVEIPNGEWRLYVTRKSKSTLFFALTFSVLGFILSLTGAFFAWFMVRQPQQLNKLVEEKTVALVSAENNLRNTLERVSDAFVAIDKNFCYTYMNKKAGEIFHRDPASIIGKNMWEEFPAWKEKPFYHTFRKAMESQKYVLLEEHYEKQNLWFESHIYPSPNGLSVFLNEITERKNAEQEILREKNLSDSIINSLPGVFYLADLEGNMLRWNKNIETVSGYLPNEIKNMRARDFVAIDDQENLRVKKEMAIKDGASDAEVNFLTKEKKELPYYITAMLSEYNNQPCLLGVGIDITARKKAEQEILEANTTLRNLSAHLQTIREEERSSISRELHDELGQQLTALKMDMVWLGKKLKDSDITLQEKIAESGALVDDTVKTIRRINTELRPGILDDLGLFAALEWQANEFSKRTGVICHLQLCEDEPQLDKNISINVFRIFQETLTNITKHANATEVFAELKTDGENLVMTIRDNGLGFDAEEVKEKKSFGLLGMKERAIAMNGEIKVVSEKGKGTGIQLLLPIIV